MPLFHCNTAFEKIIQSMLFKSIECCICENIINCLTEKYTQKLMRYSVLTLFKASLKSDAWIY